MIKIFNKRKDYLVTIIGNNNIELVEVKAKNKKEAINMVADVLMKCNIFPFISRNDFYLSCKRK